MASVDVHGKCKGGTKAKSSLRHNDKEERMKPSVQHSNPHLDKSKTKFNQSYYGRSYKEVCYLYDKRIMELDATTNTNKRSDRVTMLGLEIPRPPELTDKKKQEEWFRRVCDILVEHSGAENVLEAYWHVDEVHDYIDPSDKQVHTSVEHIHFDVIPVVDGKLNCKSFTSRKNIKIMNNEIEKMTQNEFGCRFHTGKGKRPGTVEDLKIASAVEAEKRLEQVTKLVTNKERELEGLDRELSTRETEFENRLAKREQEHNAKMSAEASKLSVRENLVTQRENEVSDIKKSLKTQISALQDIYDRIEAIDETGAKRRWNYVQQHAPQVAEKVEKAVSKIERNFVPNVDIDHRSHIENDRDLTK